MTEKVLASWKDGPSKQAILDFVAAATTPGAGFVEVAVPDQIGPARYTAHITVGFATLEDLESIEAEPFDTFDVRPSALAGYQLGNSGAARKPLETWPVAG